MNFHHKHFLSHILRNRAWLLLLVVVLIASPSAPAQCVGETEWQESILLDRLRCGRPGFLTNATYYNAEDNEETIWKTAPNLGTASYVQHSIVTYSGGASNRCQPDLADCGLTSTNSWDIAIPFDVIADLYANDGGPCDRLVPLPGGCDCGGGQVDGQPATDSCNSSLDCGNVCQTAFNQLIMLCCDGAQYFLPTVESYAVSESELTDDTSISDYTATFVDGLGSQRERHVVQLRRPYTLPEFADDVLTEAEDSEWWDGRFFMNSLIPDRDKQCLGASRLRYRIKFKSKVGVNYTARWALMVTQYSPILSTNIISGLSWSGIGNGQMLYSPWFLIPRPQLFEISDGEVLDLQIESSGGCNGGPCEDDEETPGDGPDQVGSARAFISLGPGSVDRPAGAIWFHHDTPGPALSSPSSLRFDFDPALVATATNVDGSIHLAAPLVLARIEATNRHAYWVHCSVRQADGTFRTNAPFITHLFINPDGDAAAHRLQHIRFRRGGATTNEFFCEAASPALNAWRLISGNGLRGERRTRAIQADGTRLESHRIFSPATGEDLFRQDDLYRPHPHGDRLLSRTLDPDGLALLTTNSYDAQGRLVLTVRPDGSWDRREYDATGWLRRRVRPYTDEPPSAPVDHCRATTYDYSPVPGAPDHPSARRGEPRSLLESIRGHVVRKEMRAYPGERVRLAQVTADPDAAWDAASVESTQTEVDSEQRIVFTRSPAKTTERTTRQDHDAGRTTVTHAVDDAGQSIRRIEAKVDRLGRPVSRQVFDGATGLLIDQEIYSDPDELLRPTRVTYLDGSSAVSVREDCCSAAREIDREGVATTHRRDPLGRIIASTRLGLTTSNVFDPADRLRAQFRAGPDGRAILQRALAYDRAGRVILETNALGGVTRHFYQHDSLGRPRQTTVQPDGGQRVETRHRGGPMESVVGSATHPVRYFYSVTNEGTQFFASAVLIKLDEHGQDTPEWELNLRDHAGRLVKTIYPGLPVPFRQFHYNARGQLWKERDADDVVTLHSYNARGDREFTALDANRNDVIDAGMRDRLTREVHDVVAAHDTVVHRTRTFAWSSFDSPAPTLLSTSEASVDGLRSWREDGTGLATRVRTKAKDGAYTVTETAPSRAYSVHLFRSGQRLITAHYGSNGVQHGRTTFGYDSLGRQTSTTDAHNGMTTYQFNNADQVIRTITPNPGGPGQQAQVLVTHYDLMGRPTNSALADGTRIARVYSVRDELVLTHGSRTYPVALAYDAHGRLVRMTNWTSFDRKAGARVTSWDYDPSRGWLRQKRHADERGPRYDYTAGGRILRRHWARGVTTTYSYSSVGDTVRVEYSDAETPAVVSGHDRLGQPTSAQQGPHTWRWWHDLSGELISEATVAGPLSGFRITNLVDNSGFRSATILQQGPARMLEHRYERDPAGRLASVTSGPLTARYSYIANRPWVGQITFQHDGDTRMTTSRRYDGLDRLESISSQLHRSAPGATAAPPIAHHYDYDAANQRTRSTLADGSFWSYAFDPLGQVTGAKRFWSDGTPIAGQQFEYEFDDSGNRSAIRVGGDSDGSGLRASPSTANPLNQLVQREVPPALDIIGAADATAEQVTVNGVATDRRGEYFRAVVPVDNSAGPAWVPVSTRVQTGNHETALTGHVFVPPTVDRPTYDADGNLVKDGRWDYGWDAENRLVSMVGHADLPPGARTAVYFRYDPRGRRISKTVSNWTGTAWSQVLAEAYLYDGWNLLATVDVARRTITRSFLWGADRSGTVQGAGGIGGLLAITAEGATSFPAFDGNGNVTALIDATTGTVTGRYEYGAFGELLRRTGAAAAANPFRFSTKFHDDETDLVYFGYRYYDRQTGRWISRDPIEERGGLNLYGFVGNQPLQGADLLGLVRITSDGKCNAPGTRLGTFSWKSVPISNCTKFNKMTKTYTHQSHVAVTIGFEAGGKDNDGKFSFNASTTHSQGQTEQLEMRCCSAAYWQYDFDCICAPAEIKDWALVIWTWGSQPEMFKGIVVCHLKSESVHDANLAVSCPECL